MPHFSAYQTNFNSSSLFAAPFSIFLERSLTHAGDLALVSQLTEADTADTGLSVAVKGMVGVKPSLRAGNGTAVLLFRSHLYVGTLAFRRSEVSQKGKGELPKRVENRRLSTLLGPARERRSPALRRARNPQPGNGVLLRNSCAPVKGCRAAITPRQHRKRQPIPVPLCELPMK